MNLKKLFLCSAVILGCWANGYAWVVSDKVTDVFVSSGTDLIVSRKVRHNVQLKEDDAVWEIYSKALPARPLMGMGFKDGKLSKHWEWDEAFQARIKKEDLLVILRQITGNGGKTPNTSESSFRALLNKQLKLDPLISTATCGAFLKEEKDGYRFTKGTFVKVLPWVHKNAAGKPFVRGVDRCYEAGTEAVGVILTMSGTAMEASAKGEAPIEYPNFSTETLIWIIEPPKS